MPDEGAPAAFYILLYFKRLWRLAGTGYAPIRRFIHFRGFFVHLCGFGTKYWKVRQARHYRKRGGARRVGPAALTPGDSPTRASARGSLS